MGKRGWIWYGTNSNWMGNGKKALRSAVILLVLMLLGGACQNGSQSSFIAPSYSSMVEENQI